MATRELLPEAFALIVYYIITIRAPLVVFRCMVVQMANLNADAGLARLAVKEVLSTTSLADSAPIAVKYPLRCIVVVEAANAAEILAKHNPTSLVLAVSLRRLHRQANIALDLFDSFWVEFVRDLVRALKCGLAQALKLLLIIGQVATEGTISTVTGRVRLSLRRQHVLLKALQIVAEPAWDEYITF